MSKECRTKGCECTTVSTISSVKDIKLFCTPDHVHYNAQKYGRHSKRPFCTRRSSLPSRCAAAAQLHDTLAAAHLHKQPVQLLTFISPKYIIGTTCKLCLHELLCNAIACESATANSTPALAMQHLQGRQATEQPALYASYATSQLLFALKEHPRTQPQQPLHAWTHHLNCTHAAAMRSHPHTPCCCCRT